MQFGKFEDMATSESEPAYKKMLLSFNLDRIEADPTVDLVELTAHEMAHAFTCRVWSLTEKVVAQYSAGHTHNIWKWLMEQMYEEATTMMGNALRNALVTSLEVEPEGSTLPNNGQDTNSREGNE